MSDVTLQSNGAYWKARWIDSTGKTHSKSIGPKSQMSRQQANVLCRRMAAEHIINPSLAKQHKAPKLGEYLALYMVKRTDLGTNTSKNHSKTCQYLREFFSSDMTLSAITRVMAAQWRTWLSMREITETTVCGHTRTAKVIFNHAVDMELIAANPFIKLKGTAQPPPKDWAYVDEATFDKLLDNCPNHPWKALLGLCRLAGLRRGEAMALPWKNVDLDKGKITVYATKTGKTRIVPIVPELQKILADALFVRKSLIVVDVSQHNLITRFKAIQHAAEVAPWPSPFQVLRRNCETDWAQKFPQYVVSNWIGHDIKVSQDYYLQVPQELYEKASNTKGNTNAL